MANTNDDDFVDYEDDEEEEAPKNVKDTKKGHLVGMHTTTFKDFMLKEELLQSITRNGFEHPSQVQYECIPQAILGADIICQAQSGMGKTAVFVLSTLQQITPVEGVCSCIVLVHTRELAFQIEKEFQRFAKGTGCTCEVFYGGVNIKQDFAKLAVAVPNIIVGTPGRIRDLIVERKKLDVSKVKHFILDECDELLTELKMRQDVQDIFKSTPVEKQVMMFSATLDKEIRPLCRKFCLSGSPMEIFLDDNSKLTLHGLMQYYVKLDENQKTKKLMDILDQVDFNQVVIFVSNKDRAFQLNKLLEDNNFPSVCIHGNPMKQEQRIERFTAFKAFKYRVLVATDLFGRGVDIEKINVVINYDFTDDPDQYLHRVGRAGRFGTKGLAISFIAPPVTGKDGEEVQNDQKVLDIVQSRFSCQVPPLPNSIDAASYQSAYK